MQSLTSVMLLSALFSEHFLQALAVLSNSTRRGTQYTAVYCHSCMLSTPRRMRGSCY